MVLDNIQGELDAPPAGNKHAGLLVKIFETDTPPQHMWMPSPYANKYRVLWSRELLAPR